MAARKKPVDPASIDLLGKTKDARLVVAYATQAGREAVPFLEKAFREGSAAVREGACEALGEVAPEVGTRLAIAAVEELLAGTQGTKKKPPKKELKALIRCLLIITSDVAVDRAIELVLDGAPIDVDTMPGPLMLAIRKRAAARWTQLANTQLGRVASLAGLDELAHEKTGAIDDEMRAFVHMLVADVRDRGVQARAARVLVAWGDEASMEILSQRADDLPDDVAVPVLMRRSPADAFDALAPRVRTGHGRSLVLQHLDARSDPRWRTLAHDLIDDDPRTAIAALVAIGALDEVLAIARRPALDETVRHALHTLAYVHEPRAAPILLGWLTTPEGEAYAPMLLAALGECGNAADAARVDALPVREGRAGFYAACAARIRARTGRAA